MNIHEGSCHCSAVTFTVGADITQAIECNCSHCSRKGLLLAFVPKTQLELKRGEDNLTEYRFNTKRIAHLFCKTCGVQAFGYGTSPDGTETASINLRCLPDLDLSLIKINPYDGKHN